MRRFILLIALLIHTSIALSQGESALKKGHAQINFGYPPLIGVDYAASDVITIGLKSSIVGFFPIVTSYNGTQETFFIAGIVSDFHFNKLMNLADNKDVYAGLNLYVRLDEYSTDESYIPIPGIQFGSRWYWSDTFGFNAEVGFSMTVIIGVGLTARL